MNRERCQSTLIEKEIITTRCNNNFEYSTSKGPYNDPLLPSFVVPPSVGPLLHDLCPPGEGILWTPVVCHGRGFRLQDHRKIRPHRRKGQGQIRIP